VLLFWIGIFTAGAQVSGYSAQDDYISNPGQSRVAGGCAGDRGAAGQRLGPRGHGLDGPVALTRAGRAAARSGGSHRVHRRVPAVVSRRDRPAVRGPVRPTTGIDAAHTLGVAAYQV
jgi:hypothetical protein